MKRFLGIFLVALLGTALAQSTLRIGLADDPDLLDPDLVRSCVGRIVFTSMCDNLFDINTDQEIIPQLATGYTVSDDGLVLTLELRESVVFHDGTPFNAEAVRYNLDRSKNLPGSARASEIRQLDSVEVVDDYTVDLHLSQPFSPLLAQFVDRAGVMISPTAAEAAGDDFAAAPVCAGPFRFVNRTAQDRITLEKFPDYWNADAFALDRVVYLPIPDSSVRLANLQSGDLDLIERLSATDLSSVEADSSLVLKSIASPGYQGLTINMSHPEQLDTPLATDASLREAFELALDRDVINNVVFDGQYLAGNQAVPPTSPWYDESLPSPERDVERARQLVTDAGYDRIPVEVMVSNTPDSIRVGEVIQALVADAGFDVSVRATEFATALDLQDAGDFETFQVGWSGRIDPDGNIHAFQTCDGAQNVTGYCDEEVSAWLNEARAVDTFEERKALYDQAAARYLDVRHIIYLYHQQLFFPHTDAVHGFEPYPDGMIRLHGVTID